jgi:hypothetical protein
MSYEITGNNLIAAITGGVFILMPVPATVSGTPTSFDEILIENRAIHLEAFGVVGVYQPGILSRSIQVIVRYITDDGQKAEQIRHRSPIIHVKVANDSILGIAADEFETGQVISVPPRKGATAREFTLTRIVKQNAGLVTYEVH